MEQSDQDQYCMNKFEQAIESILLKQIQKTGFQQIYRAMGENLSTFDEMKLKDMVIQFQNYQLNDQILAIKTIFERNNLKQKMIQIFKQRFFQDVQTNYQLYNGGELSAAQQFNFNESLDTFTEQMQFEIILESFKDEQQQIQ